MITVEVGKAFVKVSGLEHWSFGCNNETVTQAGIFIDEKGDEFITIEVEAPKDFGTDVEVLLYLDRAFNNNVAQFNKEQISTKVKLEIVNLVYYDKEKLIKAIDTIKEKVTKKAGYV